METLILTQEEVESLISMDEAMNAVEEAFRLYTLGRADMPPKVYLEFENGDLRAMPAHLMGYAGIKWVNSHPYNPERGLPTVMALMILNSPETGFPLAVMDATYTTSLRTGAAGGIAAKYLARKDSRVFGFVGCGTQAYFQLEALRRVFNIEEVKAYDVRKEAARRFVNHCKEKGIAASAKLIEEVCKCDVLVTTTPSRKPVVRAEWVEKGTHINAIGADAAGKQELDLEILKRAKIVVDDLEQAKHGGEINVAISEGVIGIEDIHATIGEVIAGLKAGRESEEEITIFDSTGLAIQDVAVAKVVYENAIKSNRGRRIEFFRI
ncbi:MAG: alanine dehydrogenase [Archaeoglobus sp.]|uniref:alanine dehydrogenase n=1 Tax=Archaeoglobus sp. TaxID=1872626 RepID=UPI001D6EE2AC|nr:alanine dehydrogenase [Archaeoglobus sp.]MBO8180081.1 alanine dehydrogenase [Archaeoglobus sp.]